MVQAPRCERWKPSVRGRFGADCSTAHAHQSNAMLDSAPTALVRASTNGPRNPRNASTKRKKDPMNQTSSFRLIGLAGLGALLAVPALGQSSSHFYGGVGAGIARSANETARTTGVLLPGVDTLSSSSDRNDNAFTVFGGYQINRTLALETGYYSLGKSRFTTQTSPAGSLSGATKVRGLNFDVVGTLPLTERFAGLARVGSAPRLVRGALQRHRRGRRRRVQQQAQQHQLQGRTGRAVPADPRHVGARRDGALPREGHHRPPQQHRCRLGEPGVSVRSHGGAAHGRRSCLCGTGAGGRGGGPRARTRAGAGGSRSGAA